MQANMLYLLKNSKCKATSPLNFGPPVLNDFADVASILDHAIHMSPQSKTYHQVRPPRVLSTPVVAPRVALPSHIVNMSHHDATIAGKPFDTVTG